MSLFGFIDNCDNVNTQGTQQTIYGIPAKDIDVFPALLGGTTAADSVTLDGSITPVALKFFVPFSIVSESGEVKNTLKGPNGSQGWDAMFEGSIRAIGAEAAGVVNKMKNNCGVFVIPQNDGTMRVIGSKTNPAKLVSVEHTDGKSGTDEKVYKFVIQNTDNKIAPFYTGTTPTA